MTTRAPAKIENPLSITITVSGTAIPFLADPNIKRIQINDRPQAFRTSQAEAFQGQYRDPLVLGGITNAFGARAIGSWSRPSISSALAAGKINILHDSEAETRFGYMTSPREKNTLTLPAVGADLQSSSIFGLAQSDSNVTAQMYNDRPAKFYVGTGQSGVFIWEAESRNNTTAGTLRTYVWTGAAWADAGNVFTAAGATTEFGAFDLEVHKGRLYIIGTSNEGSAAANQLYVTTNGTSWATATAVPTTIAHLTGTRLLDDGNTLWIIAQGASKRIDLYKSTDAAATWTTVATTAAQGQVRSVFKYYDETGTLRLMFMTEDAIYWIDETNSKAVRLWTIRGSRGRAAIVWGETLYIALDAMQVVEYQQPAEGPRSVRYITPGGGEAMPSGKDFREDTDGSVVVAEGGWGPFFAWTGDGPTGGTLNRALCLQWVVDLQGWHFIWRAANTTNDAGYSARGLALDPVSGDLLYLGAGVTGGNETRATLDTVRIIDAETDPRQLSADIFETAGLVETPLITVPPSEVTTTALDVFYNSENVATGVTIQTKFGTDGAAATTNTIEANGAPDAATVAIDLAKRYFPSDATAAGTAAGTEGVGSNFNTIRWRHIFAGSDTVGPLLYNSVIGYTKPTDAKDIIILDVIVDQQAVDRKIPDAETQWTNIRTVRNSKTKVTLNYSKAEGDVLAMPSAEAQIRQMIPAEEILPARRTGTVRLVFAQV